jgi:hypothetical protein
MPPTRERFPRRHHRSSVHHLYWFFTQRPHATRFSSYNDAPSGKERRRGRRCHSTRRTLVRAFAQSKQADATCAQRSKPTPQPRQPHPGAAAAPPFLAVGTSPPLPSTTTAPPLRWHSQPHRPHRADHSLAAGHRPWPPPIGWWSESPHH